ncbi:MAG: beta galactosidase jelly roll domain-containing protein [Candidatus Marinimicrobia bacterium]|nr:beta galactosidase jelly roll domain-containing protein [Candidatus Neomarinimicrobiota bacterium]
MKFIKTILASLLLLSALYGEIPLKGKWLFKLGDDSTWLKIGYNDSSWYSIKVPSFWEDQDYEGYDGYAWYRYHFSLDSSVIEQDSLILVLGRIDDVDETFLNGEKIGATGAFPPNYSTAWNTNRFYSIPNGILQTQNVLAVKVYDESFEGGIYKGPLKIITESETEKSYIKEVPRRSYYQIPFTNGIAAANYDVNNLKFAHFYPHIYQKYDDQTETPLLINYARTVLFSDDEEIPLSSLSSKKSGYVEGTGIIKHELEGENFKLTQYAFCPFTVDKPMWIFFAVIEGDDIDCLSLNFEISGKNINVDVGKWAHQKGNRKWLTVFLYYDKSPNSYVFLRKFKNRHPGFSALIEEVNWWRNWHECTLIPDITVPNGRRLYLQSLAILKMGQCREEFPTRGQIIASLPPSGYNMSRVRDQAHSINALLYTGHIEEALAALQFIMNSRSGQYKHFMWYGEDYGIGQDYAVSVSQYFGNGVENSYRNENGPNIEIDGFGLTLWNLRHYIEVTEDLKFLEYYWPKISRQIADVLVTLVDETGLIRSDSGPYRKHLPGKHYTYTSACAYRGLVDASWLARLIDDEDRADRYEDFANKIRINVEKYLFDPEENTLKGNLEDRDVESYMDISSVEALNWIFNPQDKVSKGTLAAFDKYLCMKNSPRGYRRIANEDWYDRQEGVFFNLRVISALKKETNFNKAYRLRSWINDQATQNFNLIPELYDEYNTDYQGAVPMCGLGAGAYISTFWKD